ncbi:hypothetical protein QYF36_014024 [Acer negundo]|nr:hypothetical protein QYF36_014024 [Acer negundo]
MKASQRRSRNEIHGLFDSNGVWREEGDHVNNIIIDYFLSIFQSSAPDSGSFHKVLESVDHKVCSGDNETITHILWSCKIVVEVWRILLGDETNRNSVVHSSTWWTAIDMVAWIDNFANEFRLLRSSKAGVGIIIRDYKGTVIAARSSPIPSCSSVEILEAQACFKGLQLATNIGISDMVIESNDASVIQLLSNQVVPRTEMDAFIRNILALGKSMSLLSFVAVRRTANSVAYCLAQLALSLDNPVVDG